MIISFISFVRKNCITIITSNEKRTHHNQQQRQQQQELLSFTSKSVIFIPPKTTNENKIQQQSYNYRHHSISSCNNQIENTASRRCYFSSLSLLLFIKDCLIVRRILLKNIISYYTFILLLLVIIIHTSSILLFVQASKIPADCTISSSLSLISSTSLLQFGSRRHSKQHLLSPAFLLLHKKQHNIVTTSQSISSTKQQKQHYITSSGTTLCGNYRHLFRKNYRNNNRNNNNNNNNNNIIIMKAWTCHGRNQKELIERLINARIIRSNEVSNVMIQVDRKYYANYDNLDTNYQDTPQPIGLGQTISAPHMHARALEEILPYLIQNKYQQIQKMKQEQDKTTTVTKTPATATTPDRLPTLRILDVGCGSGYLTACFGRLFKSKYEIPTSSSISSTDASSTPDISSSNINSNVSHGDTNISNNNSTNNNVLGCNGIVYGIDIHDHLIELATYNINQNDSDLFISNIIQPLTVHNGWEGLMDYAPYDAIHVGAAATSFPHLLAQQLNIGGVLIIPIGPLSNTQSLYKVVRISDINHSIETYTNITSQNNNINDLKKQIAYELFEPKDYQLTELLGVRYVPLVNKPTSISTRTNNDNNATTSATTSATTPPPQNKT